MKKIKFSSASDSEPYRCSESKDQSGWYYKAEEVDVVLEILKSILNDLPQNKDWLDPALERMANEAVGKI